MPRLPDVGATEPAPKVVTVTVRMPQTQKEALEDLAMQKRMKTGALVHTSDLIREAVSQYLERETKTK